MIITQQNIKEFMKDPRGYTEKICQEMLSSGNTQICYTKEPVIEEFPKDEGIFFIFNKILELESHTTENIANALIAYIPFMKKHKIKIIKEYDRECSLSYKSEIPNIKVDSFQTQSFYGFNKFQIINADSLSRKDEKEKIFIDITQLSHIDSSKNTN